MGIYGRKRQRFNRQPEGQALVLHYGRGFYARLCSRGGGVLTWREDYERERRRKIARYLVTALIAVLLIILAYSF